MSRRLTIAICGSRRPFSPASKTAWAVRVAALLRDRGHRLDIVFVPIPDDHAGDAAIITAFRWRLIDITRVDRRRVDLAICGDPLAAFVCHPRKALWLERRAEEPPREWRSPYGDPFVAGLAQAGARQAEIIVVGSRSEGESVLGEHAAGPKRLRTVDEFLRLVSR